MPNYKKMYTPLFNAVTDVVEKLKQAQIDTEEIHMSEPDLLISIVPDLKKTEE